MTALLIWLTYLATQIAAAMSPGPAFLMTVRTSVRYGRTAGIYTAIGLGMGVCTHIGLVMIGLAALMAQSAVFYSAIKYSGAAYLIYIGVRGLRSQRKDIATHSSQALVSNTQSLPVAAAIRSGFLTNLLNPKALVFATALIPQFVHPNTATTTLFIYWLTSGTVEILWFSFVSIVLNQKAIKQRFIGISHWIERVCGVLIISLGIKLAISKL